MRPAHRLSAFLAALLLCCAAQAQSRTGVVLQRDRVAAEWDTVKSVRNVFKVNPLLFLRGEVPLYYERALSARLSAELAVGFTFRNYINLSTAGDDADDFSRGTGILPRPSYHFGLRYYLTADVEPQGAYLQLGFAHLTYAKDIAIKDSTGALTDGRMRDERMYNDVRLYAGFQQLSRSSNWLFDVYAGVGLRSRDMHIVHETVDLVNDRWNYSLEEKADQVVAFFIGVKIGYGF